MQFQKDLNRTISRSINNKVSLFSNESHCSFSSFFSPQTHIENATQAKPKQLQLLGAPSRQRLLSTIQYANPMKLPSIKTPKVTAFLRKKRFAQNLSSVSSRRGLSRRESVADMHELAGDASLDYGMIDFQMRRLGEKHRGQFNNTIGRLPLDVDQIAEDSESQEPKGMDTAESKGHRHIISQEITLDYETKDAAAFPGNKEPIRNTKASHAGNKMNPPAFKLTNQRSRSHVNFLGHSGSQGSIQRVSGLRNYNFDDGLSQHEQQMAKAALPGQAKASSSSIQQMQLESERSRKYIRAEVTLK